jgi:quercetin dioxygenase-like cupin family protein
MADYTLIRHLAGEVTVPESGILSRTLFTDERIKVVVFGFDAGQELSEHTAATPAIIEILEGEAEVLLGGERHVAGPGTWIHMTAGLHHAIHARTPVVMLLTLLREGAG